jgi:hypothetical protein
MAQQILNFKTIAPVIKELSKPGYVYVPSFCETWVQAVKSELVWQLREGFSYIKEGDGSDLEFTIFVDSPTSRRLYVQGY